MLNTTLNNVVLASTAHLLNDDMICYRYGMSLAKKFNNVCIFGQKSDTPECNIQFHELPSFSSRIKRFTNCVLYIKKEINKFDPDDTVIFVFTPDLLVMCPSLKKRGYKIVQVYMENYYLKIKEKKWIPRPLRTIVQKIVISLQKNTAHYSYLNIFVDSITLKMQGQKEANNILLPNYPISIKSNHDSHKRHFNYPISIVYAGGIGFDRGLQEMYNLVQYAPEDLFNLYIYGKCSNEDEQLFLNKMLQRKNVIYYGYVSYDQVLNNLGKYDVGIALYKRTNAFKNIAENTTKIFEYMEFGLPIVTADFEGLKKIITEDNVGICVDTDSDNWNKQVYDFLRNLDKLNEMSENGIKAFNQKRNWDICERKLLSVF